MSVAMRVAPLLPNVRQDLLLKACLLPDPQAAEAWRKWRKSVDIDTIDAGSIRLLPLLGERLQQLGLDDPDFGRYRGVQRRTWARNRLLFRGAGRIVAALNQAEIPVMALKGVALALLYYPIESTRWMGDVDLLIPYDRVFAALDILDAEGWQASLNRPTRLAHLAIHHARPFRDPATDEVEADIHWTIMYGRYSDAAEAATWSHAEPVAIEEAVASAPSAADLLIHVCVHGMRWNDMPPVRWAVDAAMLIRSGKVDWEHFIRQAGLWGVALPLSHAFAYLRDELLLDIPSAILAELRAQKVTREQRFLFEVELKPARANRLIDVIRLHATVARRERDRNAGRLGYLGYFNALRQWHSTGRMVRWQWSRLTGIEERPTPQS
jgi:hypothetical protein